MTTYANKEDLSADEERRISEVAQDWFILLNDDLATQDDRERFAAWLAADPHHEKAFAEIRALWNSAEPLRDAFAAPPHPAVHTETTNTHSANRRHKSALWGLAAAACLAMAVFIGPQMAVNLQADYITGVGEQARIDLPDGSVAWLNTDTAIDVRFDESERSIALLRGEAQFDVAYDPDRPFSVLADGGRSTALGTVFSVRDFGGRIRTSVSEGRVMVASPINAARNRVELTPGEAVFYQRGNKPGPVHQIGADNMAAWRHGLIHIKTMPLKDALAEIDRYHPGRIVLMADADDLQPVTARLFIDALDEGVDALAATNGLTVTRMTDYLIVIR